MQRPIRTVAFFVLMCFALTFTPGCDLFGKKGPKITNPFTTDYSITEENLDFFVNGDTAESMMAATPFYAGDEPLPSQLTQEFDQARENKIKEIMTEADKLVQAVDAAVPIVEEMRSELLKFLDAAGKKEARLANFNKETVSVLSYHAARRAITKAEYNTTTIDDSNIPYAVSFAQYTKTYKAVQLAGLLLKETDETLSRGAVALQMLADHKDPDIQKAAQTFDQAMSKLDGSRKKIQAVADELWTVDYGLRQLETGDYYFAKTAVAYMQSEMPKVKEASANLKPSELLTERQINDIVTYVSFYEKWIADVSDNVENANKDRLIKVSQVPNTRYAWAENASDTVALNYSNGYASMTADIGMAAKDKPKDQGQGYLSKGWNATKRVVNEARNVGGLMIDSMSMLAKDLYSVGFGVWYGLSMKDVTDMWNENTQQVYDNYMKGIAGAETYKTSLGYVEGAETAAGELAGAAVEKTIGKGYTSAFANFVAKNTVGLFTDLAKGIYKVANPESSVGETAEGVLDIGLSMIGGSKGVCKASQLPGVAKTTGKEGILAGKVAISYTGEGLFTKDMKKLLKEQGEILTKRKLAWGDKAILDTVTTNIEITEGIIKDIKNWRQGVLKEMGDILKTGGAATVQQMKETAKESLEEILKDAYTRSLSGYLEAIKKVVGTSGTEYLDNIVGNVVDSWVKQQAQAAVDYVFAPTPAEINGNWTGTMTLTWFEPTGNEECDAMLQQSLNKPNPMQANITCGLDGKGTITLVDKDGQNSGSGPVNYVDGIFTANISQKGSAMTMTGTATHTDQGITMKGDLGGKLIFSDEKETINIHFKGVWTLIKAK